MTEFPKSPYTFSWTHSIANLSQTEWDRLAMPLPTPFLEWQWLNNLENSGSAVPRAGWLPNHLIVRRGDRLVGAAVLYIKAHSYGEFVFDHQWAELAYRLGIDYYPKLLGMTPFTPAEGYRFLIDPEENQAELTGRMVAEIDRFCDRNQVSGCHFLFVDPDWQPILESCGFTSWKHHSYVWKNQNFQTFDDYLKAFNANQRRNIKRECKAMDKEGIRFSILQGDAIPEDYFSQVYDFYSGTCDKFWGGSKYLTRKFFKQLKGTFEDRVVLAVAYSDRDESSPLGLSFCLTKGDRLYGRYWGSRYDVDCLHFNACYYQPIDWAIAHGIQSFDPGAGGRHKKRRGFPATPNHSLHRFYVPRLAKILQSYMGEINQLEAQQIEAINQELPFSKALPNLEEFV